MYYIKVLKDDFKKGGGYQIDRFLCLKPLSTRRTYFDDCNLCNLSVTSGHPMVEIYL